MALPLNSGVSISRKIPASITVSTNHRSRSDKIAPEGIPSILFLGRYGEAKTAVINAILDLKDRFSQVFVRKLESRKKPNGVEIHHIGITFSAPTEDVAMVNTTDKVDHGNRKNRTIREVNLVNTPDMGSEEMQKVHGVLKQRIINGIVSSVCFVHSSNDPYGNFQDKEWAEWRKIIEESGWTQDIFVIILQDENGPTWAWPLGWHADADSVRSFTLLLQSSKAYSKEGQKIALATSQLLKHLIIDTLPLPIPEEDTYRTLSQSNSLLLKACRMLCNYLEIRERGATTSIMSLKANIESLQPLLEKTLSAWHTTNRRLSEIDTEDLEVNEVTYGMTAMSHQINIRNLRGTPDFNFDVTCKFPIRAAVYSQSPKSTWILRHGPVAEPCRFVAEVKNRRMSSAFAKVDLFCWRRDIYHKEVEKLRKESKDQEECCRQLRSSIDSTKVLKSEAETLLVDCTSQLMSAKKDLSVLVHCEQQDWDFHDMQSQLLNDSIYGVAKAYKLSAPVLKSHFPSIFNLGEKEKELRNIFKNYRTLLDGCGEYMSAAIDKLKEQESKNRLDSDVNWLEKIIETRSYQAPSLRLKSEMEHLADFLTIYDKETVEIGLESLSELHHELDEFYQELAEMRGENQELETSYVAEGKLQILSTGAEIDQLNIENSKDAEAVRLALMIMDAGVVDLGVLASLIEEADSIKAFWSIWKGIRSKIG